MYTPDKIAMLFLKFFLAMLLLSLVTSISNIVPYYLQMNHVANDLLLRGSVNNYILQSQVDETVKNTFVENDIFKTLTYKGDNPSESAGGSGLQVYARVLADAGDAFPPGACGEIGSGRTQCKNPTRRVIINENATSWDPKTVTADMIKFRQNYQGAQRGESITVRVEAQVNAKVIFIGINKTFPIPLAVEKSGPAMHYFRI